MVVMDKRANGKLTVGQVAKKLGVKRQRVDQWMNAGRMKYEWLGNARYVRPEHAVHPEPMKMGPKPK